MEDNLGHSPYQIHERCVTNNVNKIISDIAKNYMETTKGENWTSDLINHLNSQLPYMAAPQYMDKKILPHGLPDLVQQEILDARSHPFVDPRLASFHSSLPTWFKSPGVCNPNFSLPPVDYSMNGGNVFNTSAAVNINNSGFCGGSIYEEYSQKVAGKTIAYDGMSMYSPLGIKKVEQELVTSPEEILPIRACSHGNWYSDTVTFDNGATFPATVLQGISGSSSENNVQQQCPDQVGEYRSSIGKKQTTKLNQWSHCQPYMQLDDQYKTQSNWFPVEAEKETVVRGAYKWPRLHSEQLQHAQQFVGSESSTHMSSHYILRSYMMYKNIAWNLRSDVSFLDYMHVVECKDGICQCPLYLLLSSHFETCNDLNCITCGPARRSCGANKVHLESRKRMNDLSGTDTVVDMLPPKRNKMENSVMLGNGFLHEVTPMNQQCALDRLPRLAQWPETPVLGADALEVKRKLPNSMEGPTISSTITVDVSDDTQKMEFNAAPSPCKEHIVGLEQRSIGHPIIVDLTNDEVETSPDLRSSDRVYIISKQKNIDLKEKSIEAGSKTDLAKLETEVGLTVAPADYDSGLVAEKTKIQSAFLANHFTADQIKEHLSSFSHLNGQGVTGKITDSVGQNTCQLCAKDKLLFAPPPLYCSYCDSPIKRNLIYYRSTGEAGTHHCFCTSCFRGFRGNISFRGLSISKGELQKDRNDEEKEDSWVECDRCKRWQHRICGLYNDKRDAEGNAEYICPKCCLEEIESKKCVPLPQAAAFGANGLPRTNLSDHIERRLFRCLKQEREERAKILGKKPEEVPGVEGLVVRVVVSVDRQVKVKQQFLDIFQGEDYPAEFPYRSKMIFLFQKIEGVDVCLFGMCVQEFGSECGAPNQRCVYISYLDSVKYFRPEIETGTGESLRTFVYHEILIGYLDYCKKRGFAICYIWACPLRKGDDYIFYCHPETQKTPKQDKLRQWYKSMLKKAMKENVVVDYTNLYNQFFIPTGECNTKITAARLPYFDGDYWSGAAEDVVRKIEQEESAGGLQGKLPTKRTLKAMGHNNTDVATKDVLVMQSLGQNILPVKENFMVVHLQFTCTYCHEAILSGSRRFCNQCNKIQLCSRCFDIVQSPNERRLPACNCSENHQFSEVVVNDVPLDTKDKDGVSENSFFESRETFLTNCQRDYYQFETLGHSKHSSMMILYHLIPKPTESCYQIKGGDCHTHNLTLPSVRSISGTENEQPQQQKALTLKRVLDTLMHSSQCESIPCSDAVCHQLRTLFSHSSRCKVQAAGGCKRCHGIWWILNEHVNICRDSCCRIPRCMDIKKYKEKLASRSETHQEDAM